MHPPRWLSATRDSMRVFAKDVGHGLLDVSHNTLALLGLALVSGLIFMAGQSDLRARLEDQLFEMLQGRQEERAEKDGSILAAVSEPTASGRATALDPKQLKAEQVLVVQWLSKRYRVAPEPVARLAHEAWKVAPRAKLDPLLVMAVIAIESSFNPFAQSPVGAQGLMQVVTRVHDDKYASFGGRHAAFDPVSNLKVGIQVLRDCVNKTGQVEDGLRCYVGANATEGDNPYALRVLAEYQVLQQVAQGKSIPVNWNPAQGPVSATKVALVAP